MKKIAPLTTQCGRASTANEGQTQTFLEFTLSNDTRNVHTPRRLSTETKAATKTTELIAYVVAVLAVIVTALVVGDNGNNTADPFSANDAMRYIVFLTIGYMIARGLAKSGSRDAYDAD